MQTSATPTSSSLPVIPAWARTLCAEASLRKSDALREELRRNAVAAFLARGIPTTTDEAWRKTNLRELTQGAFSVVSPASEITRDEAELLFEGELPSSRIVFVDGHYSEKLSEYAPNASGVTINRLSQLSPEMRARIGSIARYNEDPLAALNTALFEDAVVIHVARSQVVATPISLLWLSRGVVNDTINAPRTLIVAEEQAQVAVVEYFCGGGTNRYLTTQVTEIQAAQASCVKHYKVGQESESAYHYGKVQIDAHPQAVVDSCTVTFGGLVVRNEVHPTLLGEGIQCGMFGLTVLGGKQHVDNYTVLDHAKPRCESNELFKGIYGGHASGVFRGTIIVREDAQKTNAFQSNQSVLVSNDATIFSEPQLKIWADDVKCTHGATVGQLDEQALFYIRSRGVSKEEAMGMLIKAFASAVFEKVTDAALNVRLEELLTRKLQLVLHSTAQ